MNQPVDAAGGEEDGAPAAGRGAHSLPLLYPNLATLPFTPLVLDDVTSLFGVTLGDHSAIFCETDTL